MLLLSLRCNESKKNKVCTRIASAYVMTLGMCLAWRQRHPERVKLTFASVALLLALIVLKFRLNPPLQLAPKGILTAEGYVLQSTGDTCAPAAGASIAKTFGMTITEIEMAQGMGTTILGTSPGQVILGMRKFRMYGRKVVNKDVSQITPPAILFVDHETSGPESHAIALLEYDAQHGIHIFDPLTGLIRMDSDQLAHIWHGKAIEFTETNTPVEGDSDKAK